MTLPRYPAYKDSGVNWLGRVPAHWTVVPLKRLLDIQNGADHKAVEVDFGVPVIGSGGPFAFASKAMYCGESVLLGRKGTIDRPLYVDGEFWTVDTMYWSKVQPETCGRFAYYATTTIPFGYYSTSTALPSMTKSALSAHLVACPEQYEQQVIAAFLDRETAKIDALIAEQEKLLALLAEKRQATICQAVTRGLDPSAPMKQSGVEWLGQIPTEWIAGKIQAFARRESGHTPSRQHPEYWENCTVPWFSLADVWQIREGQQKYVFETSEMVSELGIANSSARLLPAGTVILSRTASVGYSAIMGRDMATTQDFVNWVCGPLLKPEFLLYVLRGMRSEFDRLMMGSTHQTIYMPDIAKLMMALPPLDEQSRIVAHLDTAIRRTDALRNDTARAIALLRERRSALITAAVTGQIDVRGIAQIDHAPTESLPA